MAVPTRKGYHQVVDDSAPTSVTFTPASPTGGSAASTGDVMVVAFTYIIATTTITPPSGWTNVTSHTTTGSMAHQIFVRVRESGDTTYVFTLGDGRLVTAVCLWVEGTTLDDGYVVGTGEQRNVNATSVTTVSPEITTTENDSLVLSMSFERTIADESDVTSISGATAWFFVPQTGDATNTISVSYIEKATAGATGDVTVTYPNEQANNGWAIQIAFPPPPVVWIPGTSHIWQVDAWVPVSARVVGEAHQVEIRVPVT